MKMIRLSGPFSFYKGIYKYPVTWYNYGNADLRLLSRKKPINPSFFRMTKRFRELWIPVIRV